MLKKSIVCTICILAGFSVFGQGYWKRVHGNGISNPPSAAGTFAPNNSPFSRYAAACITDANGNFWTYGGPGTNDLWMYNSTVNQWMIVDGDYTGFSTATVYGTQGVEGPLNTPGAATFGHASWGDLDGNLWLYGVNGLNDLWRFNTTTQMWTWMKGTGSTGPPVYGTKYVPNINNNPGMINETDCHWVDSNGDLWLYTEFDGNLWKYNITTNMWTWMSGGGTSGLTPVYGTIDVFDVNNTPGGFSACPSVGTLYTMWITSDDHLWMLVNRLLTDLQVELWEYNTTTNEWRCRRIDTHTWGATQQYPASCVENSTSFPLARTEMRAEWIDDCDHLYMFGGDDFCNTGAVYNDVWRYDPATNNYTYLKGGTGPMVPGTQGVFDAANVPPTVGGSQAWQNESGFYLMGGQDPMNGALSDDMWLYWPDTVVADYTFTTNCLDVDFTNLSTTGCNYVKEIFWDFGDGATSTLENPSHSYTANGSYNVTLIVTNCSWHADTITQVVDVNCGFTVSVSSDTICAGQCLDLIANSSSDPDSVTFSWDNGITFVNDSVVVCPLSTTTYTVIGTAPNGDVDTAQSVITVLPQPIVDLGNDTTLCGGGITLNAGNTGANFNWQDGSNNQTFWVTNSGTYWVEVNNGYCSFTDSINITINGPQVNLGSDSSFCSGQILLDATNLNSIYLWHDGSTQSTYTVSDTGLYHVQVTDLNGCVASDSIYFAPGQVNINLGPDTTICIGQSINLNAGAGWDQINWSNGLTIQQITVDQPNIYSVEVTKGICSASDSIEILVEDPEAIFAVSDTTGCAPQWVKFLDLSNHPNVQSWQWNFGDGNTSNLQHPTHNYSNNGQYNVHLVITTINGCSSDSSKYITVDIMNPPIAQFSYTPNELETGDEVHFIDESINADNWYWDFGDGNNSTQQNPSHQYPNEGNYTIMLIAQNEYCADTAFAYILVDDMLIYYVPNVFTPDGDEHNNTFKPVFTSGFDPFNYHLTIFNRWGEVLFESYNADVGWDGTYPACGLVQDGVYVWQIEFQETNSSEKHTIRGHVTLLK